MTGNLDELRQIATCGAPPLMRDAMSNPRSRRKALGLEGQYQGLTSDQRKAVDAWIAGLTPRDINNFPRHIADLASFDGDEVDDAADESDGWRERAYRAGASRK